MKETGGSVLSDRAKDFGSLLSQGAQLGMDLVGSMMRDAARKASPSDKSIDCQTTKPCGCEIPPPCWEPQPLGELSSFVCPGATATVQFRITNCGFEARTIRLNATGEASGMSFTPSELGLGPMERGIAAASLAAPADVPEGERREALVWVRGCKTYFLRWTVTVTGKGSDACHEVCVDDCPDHVHHWYDHFYCRRPCPGEAR